LLTEKEELIKTLSEKAKQFDEYMTTLQETKTKEFENVIKDIPDNLKEKYSKITDKLVLEDKIEFYKNLATDIKKEDFSNQP
jgi:predicted nuclease with TOPRIM domain